ncbi:hypothetical protein [Caldimonas brevitalea]|nr:hypothetical protein [Caldimonas brevitalea]
MSIHGRLGSIDFFDLASHFGRIFVNTRTSVATADSSKREPPASA